MMTHSAEAVVVSVSDSRNSSGASGTYSPPLLWWMQALDIADWLPFFRHDADHSCCASFRPLLVVPPSLGGRHIWIIGELLMTGVASYTAQLVGETRLTSFWLGTNSFGGCLKKHIWEDSGRMKLRMYRLFHLFILRQCSCTIVQSPINFSWKLFTNSFWVSVHVFDMA